MGIDRTQYNLLVDDDGTNTVGTVFGKQDIEDVLLTPIEAALSNAICEGRLTLASGDPANLSGTASASTIYFTPYKGNKVALYTGTLWLVYTFTERTLALGTLTASLPYDVFLYNNAGTLTLEAVAWTNGTTRATALALQDGIYVKSGATTRRYLGTFYTASTTTTADAEAQRFLWNYYNRLPRRMQKIETTNTWSYTTATWRQFNGAAANKLEVVVGVVENQATITVIGHAFNTNAGVPVSVALAQDSITTPSGAHVHGYGTTPVANYVIQLVAHGAFAYGAQAGYHYWAPLEISAAVGATTWHGGGVGFGGAQSLSGIFAEHWA